MRMPRLSLAWAATGMLIAQPPTSPAFAVASIKPSQAADFRRVGMKFLAGGRFIATNYPLQVLIAGAYHVPFQSARLTGGPSWIRSERWDVEAVADAIPAGESRRTIMRLMLQNLLTERFKLTIRRETKEMPVYGMVVAKSGLKLKKSAIDERDCFDETGAACHLILGAQGYGLHGQAADMSDLAVSVENFTDRPVVDQTGARGLFQIETTGWLPLRLKTAAPGAKAENGADLESLPSLFTVFAGLGLRLEPQKAAVEIMVIDHAEKPSAN